jgi:rod shape-determining protein MreC
VARRRLGTRRGGRFRLTTGAVAFVVAIVIGVVIINNRKADSPPVQVEAAGDDAIAAGGRVGGGLFDFVDDTVFRVRAAWDAAGQLRKLQKENNELKEWRELALTLSERMQRYEALLKMPPESLGQGENVDGALSARLILDAGGPFKRTLLANAGADHGVKLGYVALNENGLIGRVIAVGKRSSRVLLVDDYNSRVPVMGESSRARALLVGRAGQKAKLENGLTIENPQLQFVVGAGGLRKGERIVTSGDGGIYPRGILVGWAEQSGDAWVAKLGAARQPIDFIRLVPYIDPEAPEKNPVKQGALPGAPETLITASTQPAAAPLVQRRPAPALPPLLPAPPRESDETDAPPPVEGGVH